MRNLGVLYLLIKIQYFLNLLSVLSNLPDDILSSFNVSCLSLPLFPNDLLSLSGLISLLLPHTILTQIQSVADTCKLHVHCICTCNCIFTCKIILLLQNSKFFSRVVALPAVIKNYIKINVAYTLHMYTPCLSSVPVIWKVMVGATCKYGQNPAAVHSTPLLDWTN